MTTNQSIILLVVGISLFMLTAGYIVGKLVEKRKRDKEMAGIVAARLLQKPQIPEPSNQNPPGSWANANMQQQMIRMGIGSLFGNSAMGSHQGVDQSQLGNNSGFSKILGEP
jgi:hypothetical protein